MLTRTVSSAALVACMCSTAFGARTEGSPSSTQMMASPMGISTVQGIEGVTRLELDQGGVDAVREMDTVRLTDFVLGDGASVTLNLQQTTGFADNAVILVDDQPAPRGDITIFQGTVEGDPNSHGFVAFSPWGTYAMVNYGGETHVVSTGRFMSGNDPVVYNMATVPETSVTWQPFTCLADELPPVPGRNDEGGFTTRGATCMNLTVAIDTDNEYLNDLFGGNTSAATAWAELLYAGMNDIYVDQINATVEIVFLRLWTTTDPWSNSGSWDSIDQLFQFIDYWEANMTHIDRGTTSYLSSRLLGGGVAYVDAYCEDGFNYQLSSHLDGSFPYPVQDNDPDNWDIMVISHENGHQVGAPHTHDMSPRIDNCAGGDCSVTPNGTIMSYCHLCPGGLANIILEFHSRIKNEQILPYLLNFAPCDPTVPCGEPCAADFDGDGDADGIDIGLFLQAYGTGSPAADMDGDGDTDGIDVGLFLQAYGLGC